MVELGVPTPEDVKEITAKDRTELANFHASVVEQRMAFMQESTNLDNTNPDKFSSLKATLDNLETTVLPVLKKRALDRAEMFADARVANFDIDAVSADFDKLAAGALAEINAIRRDIDQFVASNTELETGEEVLALIEELKLTSDMDPRVLKILQYVVKNTAGQPTVPVKPLNPIPAPAPSPAPETTPTKQEPDKSKRELFALKEDNIYKGWSALEVFAPRRNLALRKRLLNVGMTPGGISELLKPVSDEKKNDGVARAKRRAQLYPILMVADQAGILGDKRLDLSTLTDEQAEEVKVADKALSAELNKPYGSRTIRDVLVAWLREPENILRLRAVPELTTDPAKAPVPPTSEDGDAVERSDEDKSGRGLAETHAETDLDKDAEDTKDKAKKAEALLKKVAVDAKTLLALYSEQELISQVDPGDRRDRVQESLDRIADVLAGTFTNEQAIKTAYMPIFALAKYPAEYSTGTDITAQQKEKAQEYFNKYLK